MIQFGAAYLKEIETSEYVNILPKMQACGPINLDDFFVQEKIHTQKYKKDYIQKNI